MKFVPVNGLKIAVHEWSLEGETVIFLHFLSGNSAIWNGVVPFFKSRYRTIGIDLRGHGFSDQPVTGYEISALGEDVIGVLDTLGIESAHFVGSSLGCNVSVYLAAEYPTRVKSISLSDGAMYDLHRPNDKEYLTIDQMLSSVEGTDRDYSSVNEYLETAKERYGASWNHYREQAFQEGFVPTLRTLSNGRMVSKTGKEIERQFIISNYGRELEQFYARIQCPVLFLPAARHRFFDDKEVFITRMRELIGCSSKVVVIPGTEHVMVYDFPEELSREILTFYEEIR